MLRITITDTKTNETIFETFAKCICAGISVDDDQSRSVFYQQSNGISRKDAGHCLHAVDSVRRLKPFALCAVDAIPVKDN